MSKSSYESPWMNEDLRMYRKALREFIQEEFVPLRSKWREQHRPDVDAWKQAGQTGLLLPDVPEEYGGGGGTFAHQAVVTEELAQAGVNFGCGVNPAGAMATLGLNGNAFSRGRTGCHCVLSASVFIARVDSAGAKVFNEIVSRSLDPPGVDCSSRGAEVSIS